MHILVACEESGTVTAALRQRGHNAYSADILPRPAPHLTGPVQPHLDLPWDMLIAFPPCTYLTAASAWMWKDRWLDQRAALQFVDFLWTRDIPLIAIENPPGALSTLWQQPTQYVQPYWFGDPYTKKTGLWLKGLPELVPTNIVPPTHSLTLRYNGGKHQKSGARSKTPRGLAAAMAAQWTPDLPTAL